MWHVGAGRGLGFHQPPQPDGPELVPRRPVPLEPVVFLGGTFKVPKIRWRPINFKGPAGPAVDCHQPF